jgi:hypothetical protein
LLIILTRVNEGMPGRFSSRHFYLDQFGGGESDMFGSDLLAFFIGSGDESAAGEMIGSA